MECNKEEAIRAKELAEKKMQNKDFFLAKKLALKAKHLFADIGDISQILTVCEVHCCASSKFNGEMNWYRILQVEQTADDSVIKKQYRRLALQLHPDKNKLPGAEAAFKLIGEANATLLDKAKRSWYDMKIRRTAPEVVSRPPPNENFTSQSNVDHNLNQEAPISTKRKLWSDFDCFLIKKVRKNENIPNENASNGHNLKEEVSVSTKRKVPKDFDDFVSSTRTNKVEVEKQVVKENLDNEKASNDHNLKQEVPVSTERKVPKDFDDFVSSTRTNKVEVEKQVVKENLDNEKASNDHNLKQEVPVSTKRKVWSDFDSFLIRKVRKNENLPNEKASNGHNLKQDVPVSTKRKVPKDFDDFVNSTTTKKVEVEKQVVKEDLDNEKASNDHNLKQEVPVSTKRTVPKDFDDFVSSTRTNIVEVEKQVVKENLDNEKASNDHNLKQEVPLSTKRKARKNVDGLVSSKRIKKAEAEKKAVKENLPNEEVQNASSFSCPDSEFYDFEKERDPQKFKPAQIWALYDDQDAMPRYYARIRKVNDPFSLSFTWLEHNPQSELEQFWANEGLPVACGNYRHGTSEVTKNLQMFSHEISWNKGTKRNTFDVYPRKGEVWALFKGRDDNWPPIASNHSKFEYEIVEVVSDCSNGAEFSVVQLVKVEGFVSLFLRSMDKPFQIPRSKILMFSHRVLAYRCSKNEKEGVPEGSFELDTASLPEICGSKSIEKVSSNQSNRI